MAKKKYYVVWNGYDTGIFDNWADCQKQIKGYPNASYQSFKNKDEAQLAWENGPDLKTKKIKSPQKKVLLPEITDQSISVDAACSGNPGVMEYQGVFTTTGERIFHQGPFKGGTNNIGEFLALVHGISWLQKKNMTDYVIYSDSSVGIKWVNRGKAKTTVTKDKMSPMLFQLIRRAEKWLSENDIIVEIKKWNTKDWGEIPADFGRK